MALPLSVCCSAPPRQCSITLRAREALNFCICSWKPGSGRSEGLWEVCGLIRDKAAYHSLFRDNWMPNSSARLVDKTTREQFAWLHKHAWLSLRFRVLEAFNPLTCRNGHKAPHNTYFPRCDSSGWMQHAAVNMIDGSSTHMAGQIACFTWQGRHTSALGRFSGSNVRSERTKRRAGSDTTSQYGEGNQLNALNKVWWYKLRVCSMNGSETLALSEADTLIGSRMSSVL